MTEEHKLDPASPFYLRSGDQPGNLITHVILKGDNYLAWARAITLSLKARQKSCLLMVQLTNLLRNGSSSIGTPLIPCSSLGCYVAWIRKLLLSSYIWSLGSVLSTGFVSNSCVLPSPIVNKLKVCLWPIIIILSWDYMMIYLA